MAELLERHHVPKPEATSPADYDKMLDGLERRQAHREGRSKPLFQLDAIAKTEKPQGA